MMKQGFKAILITLAALCGGFSLAHAQSLNSKPAKDGCLLYGKSFCLPGPIRGQIYIETQGDSFIRYYLESETFTLIINEGVSSGFSFYSDMGQGVVETRKVNFANREFRLQLLRNRITLVASYSLPQTRWPYYIQFVCNSDDKDRCWKVIEQIKYCEDSDGKNGEENLTCLDHYSLGKMVVID